MSETESYHPNLSLFGSALITSRFLDVYLVD